MRFHLVSQILLIILAHMLHYNNIALPACAVLTRTASDARCINDITPKLRGSTGKDFLEYEPNVAVVYQGGAQLCEHLSVH